MEDSEFEALLGTQIPPGRWTGELTANDAICQMYYAKSALAHLAYRRLERMKKSEAAGRPDLNLLFVYNMPFRSIAKMTGGMVSLEMAEGIVAVVNGHLLKGLGRIIRGFFRNQRQNRQYMKKLRTGQQ